MTSRHVGRGPGFINENQSLGVEVGLGIEPVLSSRQDIRTILLRRMGGLFFPCDLVAREEAPQRANCEMVAILSQLVTDFGKGQVVLRRDQGIDPVGLCFDPV
ncbi:hypothetical protein AA21291_1975 [Swaminathania salitolerans LMG 21291]|uniref:Uncharacterized protein n=1 Tax=Swaminathania salitolerans TaxID=182838 RepID=A0A511BNI8_9PROT|nr:hypothetical protein AA21291_1975 [Swaminathania salitolerans LMG 21291]GEL01907.1 hypothetical protein SSA02_10700 [Swaminathania salitolerans]